MVVWRIPERDVGDEVGEHNLLDTRFTKTGQNTTDVTQKKAVRADDQHALIFQWETMGVEQIRSAVQRHDRLACAGTTLYNQNTRVR